MKEIKLMADYHCHPLWGGDSGDFSDISPEELPISLELKNSLNEWAKRYDDILNVDDPASSSFKSEKEEKLFVDDGYKLAECLKRELGNTYKVTYHSDY